MKCVKCGQEVNDSMRFCPHCGTKNEPAHKTVQLRCKECGGTLQVDAGKSVLVCPFCQSTELLVESDEVTIQRIKSNTYKEVEMEKLRHEEAKDLRAAEEKKKEEDSRKAYTGKYGKIAVFCLVMAIICAMSAFASFRSSPVRIVAGLVSAVQAIVFLFAWIKGRKNSYGKTQTKHKMLAILGFLMFGFISLMSQNNTLFPQAIVEIPSISETTVTNENEGIFCYPVRNYAGRNAASIGKSKTYYRIDEYGDADLRIVFVAENGVYIDPQNENQLQNYIVYAQSIPAGSTLTAVNGRYSNGKPSSLVDYQSHEEIILYVHAIDEETPADPIITTISLTPDRRTYHVRDYVGRNAAAVGPKNSYKRIDEYGRGDVKIIFTSVDGTYIDATDLETLRQYVVVSQDVVPNTQIKYTYTKYSSGSESDLVDYQNITEINLTVQKLDPSIIALMPEITPTPEPEPTPVALKLDYKIQGDNAIVTGYYGEGTVVEIPRKLGGKEVTAIDAEAFKNCSTLESITIWADLTTIGDSAFEGCTSLTEISIPNETTHIGKRAFMNCTSLSSALIWGDPDIDDYSFAGCTALDSISISNDTKRIGAHAFEGCTGITELLIWGVDVIEEYAFAGCTGIDSVSIPHDVVRIEAHAFDGCTALTSLIVWDDDTQVDRQAFSNCPNLDSEYAAPWTATPAPTNTPKPTEVPTATPLPTATPTPYISIYDVALVRKLNDYSVYYLIDLDEKVARYFSTDDTGVLVGKVSGALSSGLTITYTYDGSTWSEKITYCDGSKTRVTLVDGNGFDWEFTVTDIESAEKILEKPGYHDMN